MCGTSFPTRALGLLLALAVTAAIFILTRGEGEPGTRIVVCYAALDEEFSRPLLERFQAQTGIKVLMKFDTESTKSVGLANALIAQRARPRCDVFWNNEVVNTIRLKRAGVLARYRPRAARAFPACCKDPDGTWNGFAARARVLLVNTRLVPRAAFPRRTEDLLDPRWRGRIGLAKPLFGTTATHIAVLYARRQAGDPAPLATLLRVIREQRVRILGGNKSCARAVAAGDLAMAFTDTDDAIIEKEAGKPVELVYLDAGREDTGTLFIPNTLSIIKGCPHPQRARRLVEFLLSPQVEEFLARSSSAQIPLNPGVRLRPRVARPGEVKPMAVDWERAAACFQEAARWVEREILAPAMDR